MCRQIKTNSMRQKIVQNAKKIAETSLGLGSIKLTPTEPITWASGTQNPIYNDNRMLLASYESRMLVANSLLDLLMENQIDVRHVDYICGTTLSGIGPATTLADILEKKLLIFSDGIPYEFSPKEFADENSYDKPIVSSAPFGIPVGIMIANRFRLPYSYIRPQVKKHGLQKLIEGAPVITKCFDFINIGSEQEMTDCGYSLHSQNLSYDTITLYETQYFFHKVDLQGKCVVVVEDLISTGASFAKEADACINAGAEVTCVLAIFNYELESSKELITKTGYDVYSVLTYKQLLVTAENLNYIQPDNIQLLKEWREDQPNWGEKHGFSAVKK